MNRSLEKYISDNSAEKLCSRIKARLSSEGKKYFLKPIEKCDWNSNLHFELIIGKPLTCLHTITGSTTISMKYPLLDKINFIDGQNFPVRLSGYEREVSFTALWWPSNFDFVCN